MGIEKGTIRYSNKQIADAPYDKTSTAIVKDVGVNGYTILINNQTYTNVPTLGGICDINETVKVVIPQNNYNNMFILKTPTASSDSFVTSVNSRNGDVILSKSDVGLGNVTNESKTTMFTNPTFTGTATATTFSGNLSGNATSSSRVFDSEYKNIVNPAGGLYRTMEATKTGAIAITLPVGMTNTMISMTIKIYEYATNESFEVNCGGYAYSGNLWKNTFAYIIGNPSMDRRFTVRFGRTSANKAIIYIGELESTWSIPQVTVTDVQCGYSGYSVNFTTGWSIGFATAFENVNATVTGAQVGYALSTNTANATVLRDASGNFSAGTITASLTGNASTATKLATPRNITLSGAITGSANFDGSANITIVTTGSTSSITWEGE